MKNTTVYGLTWLSCAVAAVVGIIVTKSIAPLLVFLIPAYMPMNMKD